VIEPLWQWVVHDSQGRVLAGPAAPAFSSRFDAEVWLGERWRTLAAGGAAQAQLCHAGQAVGSPVPLQARA